MELPVMTTQAFDVGSLRQAFGDRLQEGVSLKRFTAARVGGPAQALLEAQTIPELIEFCDWLWRTGTPFWILGGGSNVLISDAGVPAVTLLNRARKVRFGVDEHGKKLTEQQAGSAQPLVFAESGANFGLVARQAAQRGLAGLEWAGGIPGTVGGAVVGNAGAHGGDIAGNLVMAEILHHAATGTPMREYWTAEVFRYGYRTSLLKRQMAQERAVGNQPGLVVLSAVLRLERSTPEAVQSRMEELVAYRRKTQPPGASMGSMFKNPPGDYAGRLIERAGLKGARLGGAEISALHANFFINRGEASAQDIDQLIRLAQQTVFEQSGVQLELEIERIGVW